MSVKCRTECERSLVQFFTLRISAWKGRKLQVTVFSPTHTRRRDKRVLIIRDLLKTNGPKELELKK